MKKIHLTSPAGSGNTFAEHLIRQTCTCKIEIGQHGAHFIDFSKNNVFILRNPYDSVASAVERHLESADDQNLDKKDLISNKNIEEINKMIHNYVCLYGDFLSKKVMNSPNVFKITFETLTHNKTKFIKDISEYFNIPVDQDKLSNIGNEEVFDSLKVAGRGNRIPRPYSPDRLLINDLIQYNKDILEVFGQYWRYRKKLDNGQDLGYNIPMAENVCSYCDKFAYTSKLDSSGLRTYYCSIHIANI